MTNNVREFENALRGNEALRKQYEAELKRIAEAKEAESDAEAVARAAKALGYDFTAADFEKACAEKQELDPDDLAEGAGGFCMLDYDCCDAWKHDTPNKPGTSCFKDYDCAMAWHNPELFNGKPF